MCKINLNSELNGIELSFESKPDRATLDAIKAQGFRWNGRKMVWYAKQTEDRLTFAQSLGQIETASKQDGINLDNLATESKSSLYLCGADLSAAIREDLKKRGVKGVSVRASKSTYTDHITVTVKATADDMASIEEAAERYNMSHFVCDMDRTSGLYTGGRYLYYNDYKELPQDERIAIHHGYIKEQIKRFSSFRMSRHMTNDRKNYWEVTTAFYNKLSAIFQIANQFNYDHSDSMSDYFDVGYFLDIDIKTPEDLEIREEMTEEERTAYAEELRLAEEERARQMAEYEAQKKKDAEEAAKYKAWHEEAIERIYNDVSIDDLEEEEQIYITNLVGGYGKDSCRAELDEAIARNKEELRETTTDAVIDRIIMFHNEQAWEDFNNLYLDDFIFLAGKGGTGSEDIRLEGVTIYQMTTEQRESVKFYSCHCVGVVYKGELQLVIDPQGYSYARYVYLPTEKSEQRPAPDVLKEQENDSKLKPAFHFPAKIAEQAAALHEGQDIPCIKDRLLYDYTEDIVIYSQFA